ncbi:MAG: Na+-transporting NADH:ubiquinone oxidoreductase subunit [Clostridiales bacterium]|jgi:Na+-transporting NADH:ubiquinone oxidoreductase subunit F|nr:Na+-transporting NADH:ubiquinone oxidoreductase subunit [Clostridiales bacterium]
MAIVITVATISGITGLLALLLSVANRTIADYGEKEILINGEKTLTVDGGDTLLSALVEQKIFIPSACGGKGSCGYCKVTVLEGGGEILPTELGYVSPEERKAGVRLSCQLKVRENLKIQIPEELFSVRQYEYEVAYIKDVTPTIKHLRLELPASEEIDFKPGQYVQLLAPKYKGNDSEVYRAYSIASSPSDTKAVELFIGYVERGIATTFVHHYLKPGAKVTVVGPYGDFYYHESDKEMILVAIGTGMSPILSILKYMRAIGSTRKATFYFGARTCEDLFEMETLAELERDLPNFKLVTCLSRPEESCHWEGNVGRVTNMLEKYLMDDVTHLDKEAYLCGSPVMIDSVIPILTKKGVPEAQIYYDKF